MEAGTQLTDSKEEKPHVTHPYQEIIGSLMYTVMATKPDIAFAPHILTQFTQAPTRAHWEAAKLMVWYLKTTCNLELTYHTSEVNIVGYIDADHASQLHWHSISRYIFHIGVGAVMWSSKKQLIVTLSTTEAEYIMAAHVTKEAMWLCALTA